VKGWNLKALDLKPRLPEILSSTPEARAIALDLGAGESLPNHEVHERAWLVIVDGEVEVTSAAGERMSGGGGLLVEFAQPSATKSLRARTRGFYCCSPRGRVPATQER
jgi:hypothetical protein